MLLVFTSVSCSNNDEEELESGRRPNINIREELCQYGWETQWQEEFSEWGNGNMSYTREKTILYFFENGKGILRYLIKEDDTYFGNSRRDEPYGFEYTINGNSLYLKFEYNELYLQFDKGVLKNADDIYNKTSYDYEWVGTAKYAVMDDDERYSFPVGVIVDGDYKKHYSCYQDDEQEEVVLNVGLTVPASAMASARKIDYIRAVFKLEGSYWCHFTGKVKNPEITLLLPENQEATKVEMHSIPFNSKEAKLIVEIYYYDNKYNREVYIEDWEFDLNRQIKNAESVIEPEPSEKGFTTTLAPGLTIVSNGDYPWSNNNNYFTSSNGGISSTKSILYIQVNPIGGKAYENLSFDWEVSCEPYCDELIIKEAEGLVSRGEDGDEVMTVSGEQSGHVPDWSVSRGNPRTFIVIYKKDGSINSGQDRAIIKNIKLNGK